MYNAAKELMKELNAGCSAFSWETEDGKHLWGRNFDFNRIADSSRVTYLPENLPFYTKGTGLENNLDESTRLEVKYSSLGIGSLVLGTTPTLFEGINEKGLMGGQLYYRKFASYPAEAKHETLPVQPAFAVTYFLTQCAGVEEVVKSLEEKITLVNLPVMGSVPTVHWIFTDRTGETVIIEPDRERVHVYRNSMGILANSPGYPWHCENLLNYAHIKDADLQDMDINGMRLEQCFSGTGGLGLPGDFSSPSRFVRLAFLKKFCLKGENEEQGTARMFRIFQNAAFPLGMVRVGDTEDITGHDVFVSDYDYTIYTAVMCAESLKFYWTTYENMGIQCAAIEQFKGAGEIKQINLIKP